MINAKEMRKKAKTVEYEYTAQVLNKIFTELYKSSTRGRPYVDATNITNKENMKRLLNENGVIDANDSFIKHIVQNAYDVLEALHFYKETYGDTKEQYSVTIRTDRVFTQLNKPITIRKELESLVNDYKKKNALFYYKEASKNSERAYIQFLIQDIEFSIEQKTKQGQYELEYDCDEITSANMKTVINDIYITLQKHGYEVDVVSKAEKDDITKKTLEITW